MGIECTVYSVHLHVYKRRGGHVRVFPYISVNATTQIIQIFLITFYTLWFTTVHESMHVNRVLCTQYIYIYICVQSILWQILICCPECKEQRTAWPLYSTHPSNQSHDFGPTQSSNLPPPSPSNTPLPPPFSAHPFPSSTHPTYPSLLSVLIPPIHPYYQVLIPPIHPYPPVLNPPIHPSSPLLIPSIYLSINLYHPILIHLSV